MEITQESDFQRLVRARKRYEERIQAGHCPRRAARALRRAVTVYRRKLGIVVR